MKLFPADQ